MTKPATSLSFHDPSLVIDNIYDSIRIGMSSNFFLIKFILKPEFKDIHNIISLSEQILNKNKTP